MSLFIVRDEGGEFESVSAPGLWRAFRSGVPIVGVLLFGRRYIYDRIMRTHGWGWYRSRKR